jgi:hypothetical protein
MRFSLRKPIEDDQRLGSRQEIRGSVVEGPAVFLFSPPTRDDPAFYGNPIHAFPFPDAKCAYYWTSQESETMLDRVQITRLDESIPRWQIRDIKVSTSQLRYALRASEEQIQEAVNLKPGQQMTIDLYP